jgi:hypothetical protein
LAGVALAMASVGTAQQRSEGAAKARLADFMRQVSSASRRLRPIEESCLPLLDDGRIEEVVDCLLSAVPESQRTPAQDFVMGNLLSPLSPARSLACYDRAFLADPENPCIALPWAIQMQRAGDCGRSGPVFGALSLHPDFADDALQAIEAEALLRLGRPQAAVSAWRELDIDTQRPAIERALGWVHAPPSPWVRRAELRQACSTRNSAAARDLVLLDLRFDVTGDGGHRRDDYLATDLALLDSTFGETDRRSQELHALVLLDQALPPDSSLRGRSTVPDPDRMDEAIAALGRLELIGHDPFMARDPLVARRLFELFQETRYATAGNILDVFADVFEDNIEGYGDREALHTYCRLLRADGRRMLEEVARHGWEGFRDPECASILIEASIADGQPEPGVLDDALEEYPDDVRLLRLAVSCDQRVGRASSPERLTALILACASSAPDARELDDLYGKLAEAASR